MSQARALNKLRTHAPSREEKTSPYQKFDELNGYHSWQKAVPEGYVLYPVERVHEGKVCYFNYDLAREMGLIPHDHPRRMTPELSEKILDTFSLRIINEYDQSKRKIAGSNATRTHMATRYLQLQHFDKAGRTSGDGRSIWNGTIRHNGKIWDVGSRGTGVTRLAPGSVKAKKFLKTGSTHHGYGCGLADLDELYGAAIMSETFHLQGYSTERVLAIIDLGHGAGIGVRAGQNLFRPAHLFGFFKQRQREVLKRAFDFIIDRQIQNEKWPLTGGEKRLYHRAVEFIAKDFARSAAHWEMDYIFVWLAWDGDNVLLDGGIIDYGSVRQFGLRHDQYRYDDVERWSTSLPEQRRMARQIVSTFLQVADFLEYGRVRTNQHYKKHEVLKNFDDVFQQTLLERFLFRLGLPSSAQKYAMKNHRDLVQKLFKEFQYFEKLKTRRKESRLPDGINKPAIMNMRRLLYSLPRLLNRRRMKPIPDKTIYRLMNSFTASSRDLKFRKRYQKHLRSFQTLYRALFESLPGGALRQLAVAARRCQIINRPDRLTGNAVDIGVQEIIAWRKKGIPDEQIQRIIDGFIQDQGKMPSARPSTGGPSVLHLQDHNRLLNVLMSTVYDYSEDV